MFCIAFLVRTYVGAPIVAFLAPRLIGNRLHGFARGAALTVLGVSVTSPITGAIIALLFVNVDDFLDTYLAALVYTMPLTIVISHFIVGPAVKLLFNNRISPSWGLGALRQLQQHAPSILRLFGM